MTGCCFVQAVRYTARMKKLTVPTLLAAALLTLNSAFGNEICATINHCRVEKKTFRAKEWKSDYVKELNFDKLCSSDRPSLQVEPELGIELWLFDALKDASNAIEAQPHVTVDLFTHKPTFVVATGTGLIDSNAIGFSYRLTPKGGSVVDVACYKR